MQTDKSLEIGKTIKLPSTIKGQVLWTFFQMSNTYQKHVKLYSSLPEFESKHAAITANSKESHS